MRVKNLGLRAESAVSIIGRLRRDERAPGGIEFDADEFTVLNQSADKKLFERRRYKDRSLSSYFLSQPKTCWNLVVLVMSNVPLQRAGPFCEILRARYFCE
jgi:aspartyl/asparaginyl-tRNA synthetase